MDYYEFEHNLDQTNSFMYDQPGLSEAVSKNYQSKGSRATGTTTTEKSVGEKRGDEIKSILPSFSIAIDNIRGWLLIFNQKWKINNMFDL